MTGTNPFFALKNTIKLSEIIGRDLKLEKTSKKDEFVSCCPFHADNSPSFRIFDATGKYWCFGCQAQGDVFDFLLRHKGMDFADASDYLGLKQGDDDYREADVSGLIVTEKEWLPLMPVPGSAPSPDYIALIGKVPAMVHQYKNIDGLFMFGIMRIEGTASKKKYFLPLVYGNDNKWHKEGLSGVRTIYGLSKLKNHFEFAIATEGEKKCDKLQEIMGDIPVISWANGCGSARLTDWTPVKRLYLWPDNDEAGRKVIAELAQFVDELYVMPVPKDKPKGWDAYDAITVDGYVRDDVMDMIRNAVLYEAGKPIKEESPLQLMPDIPLSDIGLVGEIAEFINSTSLKYQPMLALGAAICATGVIMGHKVCTQTNLRTNVYVLGIANTGAGKDASINPLSALFGAAGVENYLGGDPGSSEGLLSLLSEAQGKRMVTIDEVGKMLSVLTHPQAQSYQKGIITNIIKIYSRAGGRYYGTQLANRGNKTPRIDIEQPCLCLYGISVEEHVHSALSSTDAIDGFLSRWIIIEGDHSLKKKRKNVAKWNEPPKELVEKIVQWGDRPKNFYPNEGGGNLAELDAIRPQIIRYTPEAEELMDEYEDYALAQQKMHLGKKSPVAALWTRAEENAAKIALCFHTGDSISASNIRNAQALVNYSIAYMGRIIQENIADNEFQKRLNVILGLIRKDPGIMHSRLLKYSRLPKKILQEIVDTLIDSEQVRIEDGAGPTKRARLYFCA